MRFTVDPFHALADHAGLIHMLRPQIGPDLCPASDAPDPGLGRLHRAHLHDAGGTRPRAPAGLPPARLADPGPGRICAPHAQK